MSLLTPLTMTISTIANAVTCIIRGGGCPVASESSLAKDEGALKIWLKKLAEALKRLVVKLVEALSAIVESVFGAILSFFSQSC